MNGLETLDGIDGTLHLWNGRLNGHLCERHSGVQLRFRGRDGEAITVTLERAIRELERRRHDGMPQTIRQGPCEACGSKRDLRRFQQQWLCDDCRRGLRTMVDDRRRAARRRHWEGRS